MQYLFKEFTLRELVGLVDSNQIDLNPPYQRNFIWSSTNQKELIDSILKGYPLPSFFFYQKPNGKYEMVDGQQRTKTVYRFINGEITTSKSSGSLHFNGIDQLKLFEYRIIVVIISNLTPEDSLNDFYVLINKKGIHLNTPEMNKSEFYDKRFLQLSNSLLIYQNFIDLNLFSDAVSKRMNDRAFVEELLGYLYMGIKDKKQAVEMIYENDISEADYKTLEKKFTNVIDRIYDVSQTNPISETRYKQRNDFYTLFAFINENISEDLEIAKYQYKILLILDGKDLDGRQLIRPSNNECEALREYANNCVTQSNSKSARESRLNFFNSILKNPQSTPNDTLLDVLNYLTTVFDESIQLREVGPYYLLDIDKL